MAEAADATNTTTSTEGTNTTVSVETAKAVPESKTSLVTEPAKTATETKASGDTAETKDTKASEGAKDSKATAELVIDTKALKFPEGFTADEKSISTLQTILTNDKLTPTERAQALIDEHTSALAAASKTRSEAWDGVTKQWITQVSQSKDIGTGDMSNPLKPEVHRVISAGLEKYGSQELKDVLDLTGAGNNPHVITAFYKMFSDLKVAEGGHVQGNPPGNQPKSAAATLYPNLPE